MSQTVIKTSETELHKMKEYYKSSLKPNPPSGAIFAAKVEDCSITAYRSGKVLFQGKAHNDEASKWGKGIPSKEKGKQTKAIPNSVTKNHIGSDEAGSGDFFGPMTAAAAYVEEKNISLLKELGVKDSKLMKDETILEVAKHIQQVDIPYSILVLRNNKYNALQRKGWTQGKMKVMLHYHAIQNVLDKINQSELHGIVVDQFAEASVFKRHLASEKRNMPEKMHFITKAESYSIAVAAASILSRAKFVQEMDRLSKEVGFSLQKGASKLVDEQAAKIILSKGRDTLTSISKVHFANTTKAWDLIKKRNQ